MSRVPHAVSAVGGRGLAWIAGLAVLAVVDRLARRGHLAASVMAEPGGAGAGAGPAPAAGDASGADAPTGHERRRHGDSAPGGQGHEGKEVGAAVRTYLVGLVLAALLTAGSFSLSYTDLVYAPGIPVALIVFAIAQIGVHLVFFLHLTTSPDHINNALALVFGTLIVVLLIGGTLWIMSHMNANMVPTGGMPHMAPGSGMRH